MLRVHSHPQKLVSACVRNRKKILRPRFHRIGKLACGETGHYFKELLTGEMGL